MAYYPVAPEREYTARITYWLGKRYRPPFADAQSPDYYSLESFRGEEKVNYKTVRGYKRHVAMIRNSLRIDGGRIITEYVNVGGNGYRYIVYRPGWERGPHAMPHIVTIPPCEIDE